jgi:hypothetical protein
MIFVLHFGVSNLLGRNPPSFVVARGTGSMKISMRVNL